MPKNKILRTALDSHFSPSHMKIAMCSLYVHQRIPLETKKKQLTLWRPVDKNFSNFQKVLQNNIYHESVELQIE